MFDSSGYRRRHKSMINSDIFFIHDNMKQWERIIATYLYRNIDRGKLKAKTYCVAEKIIQEDDER